MGLELFKNNVSIMLYQTPHHMSPTCSPFHANAHIKVEKDSKYHIQVFKVQRIIFIVEEECVTRKLHQGILEFQNF